MGKTTIEWTDYTFNPWLGCTKVSPGCDHCYAEARMDKRLHVVQWGAGQPRKRTKTWGDPVKWNKAHQAFYAAHGRRQRVFCASLADVFDNEVPAEWRADLFDLIRRCENLDFLLLTKRVGNVTKMLLEVAALLRSEHGAQTERERGLQAGSVGRVEDRLGGANLARDEADGRPLDRRDEGDAMRAGPSGDRLHGPGRLSAGASDDRRAPALRGGGTLGVAPLQGTHSAGADGQPSGRPQAEQPADESRTGDVQRAAAACGAGVGRGAPRREGFEQPEGTGDGNGCGVDAPVAGEWLEGEGHRGAVRDHAEVGLAHLHRQDLAARAALLGWVERWLAGDAPPNVWIGATVVNQEEFDRDVPKLDATPAAVRFLSVEPMLGPIVDSGWLWGTGGRNGIDWVICGGESGPGARPMHADWARSLRDQCAAAGVPFLFKQWGEWLPWTQFSDAGVDDPPEQTRFKTAEWEDGQWRDVGYPMWCDSKDGVIDDMQCAGRVGKKAAGRLLDGAIHNAFPEARHVVG